MDFDVTRQGHGVGRLTYLSSEERPQQPEAGDVFQFHPGFDATASVDMERIIEASGEILSTAVADFEAGADPVVVSGVGSTPTGS